MELGEAFARMSGGESADAAGESSRTRGIEAAHVIFAHITAKDGCSRPFSVPSEKNVRGLQVWSALKKGMHSLSVGIRGPSYGCLCAVERPFTSPEPFIRLVNEM